MKPRKDAALDAESLVLGKVQVEHVELDRRHRIEGPLEDLRGHEMPADIHEDPAPGKTRAVAHGNRADEAARFVIFDELKERLETPDHPDDGRRAQHGPLGRDVERVRLVLTDGLDRFARPAAFDHERGARSIVRQSGGRRPILRSETGDRPSDRAQKPLVGVPAHNHLERAVEVEAAAAEYDRLRDRQQRVRRAFPGGHAPIARPDHVRSSHWRRDPRSPAAIRGNRRPIPVVI